MGVPPAAALLDAPLTPRERRLVAALVEVYPRAVDRPYLAEALYGDDPDGGPESAFSIIGTLIHRLRVKLPAYGWTIPKNRPGSGNKGRYRLETLS